MNAEEIITAGLVKNYPGKGYDPLSMVKAFEVNAGNGVPYFQLGPVIVSYTDAGNGLADFHCINAGGAGDLVPAVLGALAEMAKTYAKAVTFYDSPKVSALMAQSTYPVTVTRIDDGEYRTFKAEFDLRS